MPTYNYKSRELIAKIVYYGPGRCGKTTNLQQIHARMRPETRSELLSVATETDRTIYFDLLPLNLGTISGMKFMVRLFTVPGQVYYSETRKLVLKGADGVVFVADSQDHMADENRQSLADLRTNLAANGLDYQTIPLVMQYNKRDLPPLITEAELDAMLNDRGVKSIAAVASDGKGVLETLRYVTLSVFNHIKAGGKTAGPTRPRDRKPMSTTPSGAPAAAAGVRGRRDPSSLSRRRPPAGADNTRPPGSGVQPGSWAASIPRTSVGANNSASPVAGPANNERFPATQPATASAPPAPREGPGPMRVDTNMVMDEFRNLAVMHSQLAERVSQLETELSRLGRDFQEMREYLARQSRA